uniref:RNA-binding protein 8A n=1 Tax=Alexandrium andersonii TaxID=327968 RepID=A0A7S2EYS4_9DINO|mmetsp:Transcript_101310/g.227262  ORF Transcript_101310/g.227262 Transcript_101310/m.227262 type:complete len:145 (+) Transcript_101310:2-436(+)
MDADYDEDMPEEGSKPARKVKGRGAEEDTSRYSGKSGVFESLPHDEDDAGPARSIEGWVIIVSGVHEEAQEDDVFEAFAEFGDIKNLHLNLDRRTGFVKGYAFIEYETKQEAEAAIKGMDNQVLLEQRLSVHWAFSKPSRRRRR